METTLPQPLETPRRDLALFIALAAGVRLAFVLIAAPVIDSADALGYLESARRFAEGDWSALGAELPPFYPLLCALMHFFVRDWERACLAASFFMSVLLVVPVYRLSAAMHGRAAARVSALLVGLWPWLADYAGRIGPEACAVTLWFCAVWWLVCGLRGNPAWMAASALAFFAFHLTRPEGTFLMVAALPAAGLLCGRKEYRRLGRLLPFVALLLLLLGLQSLLMRWVTGEAVVNARVRGLEATMGFLLHRGAAIVKALATLSNDVLPVMIGPYLLVFAGAVLFREASPKRDLRIEAAVACFVLAQVVLAGLSSYPEPRYVMAPVVAVALWGAHGIAAVTAQARAHPRLRRMAGLPVAGLVAMLLFNSALTLLPEFLGQTPRQPREYRIAGEWMRDHCAPGLIVTRKPQVGYYAGMPTSGPGEAEPLADLLVRMDAMDAKYLVIDERYTAKLAPALFPLLDPANAPPPLECLASDLSPYPGARIVIYAFRRF